MPAPEIELDGVISTRTPHAGSDFCRVARGAVLLISTRTPHAGSDSPYWFAAGIVEDFNPHSPCGE